MPIQLEEKIELSFDINFAQAHTMCDQTYCVNKGEGVCISEEFKEYLKKNNKIDQHLVHRHLYKNLDPALADQYVISKLDENKKISFEFQKNDLQWLIESDQKIKVIFASADVYRMRFKYHDQDACSFINKIFQFSQIPPCRKLMEEGKPFMDSFPNDTKYQGLASDLYDQIFVNNVLWNSTLKNNVIARFERYFSHLCDNARKTSVSDIYRLFDIANRYDSKYQIRLSNFLALLYALGHGNERQEKVESISEFVSYFEFFQQFSEGSREFYYQMAKKESNYNFLKRSMLDNYVFLASDEGFKKAKEVWDIYHGSCLKLFKDEINFDACITDEEFIRSLKSHLACTRSPFPLNFSSIHSAAYHSYKHKDLCKVPAEELQVCSYLELIREVVLNGHAFPSRPDQFGKGKIYTFKQKRLINNKLKDVHVYILKGQQKSTFLLSCH